MTDPAVDRDKVRQKIQYVREALRRLADIRARGDDAFLADPILQAAATRWLQVAIEAVIDAANHIIAREGLGLPKTYREAVEILAAEGILPKEKTAGFVKMVKFRNRAVHLYDEISPGEILTILQSDLGDFEDFIGILVKRYLSNE
ncbi:MAG: DUF86 domain-containing protein [Acidobacteria bacterium]|nr:DUF86 domain-containing protein [Acidobacteriota bacterium]